ncbi:MAG: sulfite exporter TauE/SafE family protein [Propionibacteriaceae bacterium]|nr:sulfite exporter TauE/SafE family protein [Propionibacteriaceae bacterium]
MEPLTFALLVVAGVGTGVIGYLTGLASLVSYPSLLAAGLSPVTANVSNTLGLVGIGIGTTARAGRRFRGERARLAPQLAVAAAGGLAGALLLLLGAESTFEAIVPWLIVLGSVALLAQPWLARLRGEQENVPLYLAALFVICLYGGYFGAGAGVIYLAVTLIATSEPFGRAMVLKSILLGVTNLIAALAFIIAALFFGGPANWWAALALGLGCIVGGWLGPRLQEFLPERGLRVFVALCGFGLAAWLVVR